MVERIANGDVDQVETRLREALDAHGLRLFACIDHAAGARKADVPLEANVLLRLADRYALGGHQQTLERQTAMLTKLAAAAAG